MENSDLKVRLPKQRPVGSSAIVEDLAILMQNQRKFLNWIETATQDVQRLSKEVDDLKALLS